VHPHLLNMISLMRRWLAGYRISEKIRSHRRNDRKVRCDR
jgi:hypothetical protein